jgi:hypothetical protein
MLDTTIGAETGTEAGEIGIGRQGPSDASGTASGKDAAIGAGTATPSWPAICSASAWVL